jgi:hypothetical protein
MNDMNRAEQRVLKALNRTKFPVGSAERIELLTILMGPELLIRYNFDGFEVGIMTVVRGLRDYLAHQIDLVNRLEAIADEEEAAA